MRIFVRNRFRADAGPPYDIDYSRRGLHFLFLRGRLLYYFSLGLRLEGQL